MKLTAFVITYGRPALLETCVRSALTDLPNDSELRVLVNGTDPEAEAWLSSISDPRLHWRITNREPRTLSRNRGFQEALGEVLYFLDDDVEIPPGLFREVLRRFDADPELAVLGGPNLTPPESSAWEWACGAVFTSAFAAPLVCRRYSAGGKERTGGVHALILCNLAVRRAAIPVDVRFRAGLRSNEENLFLHECERRRLKIRSSPRCAVFHRRRSTVAGFVSQVASYGYGRAQQCFRAPASNPIWFLVPPAVVAAGPGLVIRFPWLLALYAAGALIGALGSREARQRGWGGLFGAASLTAVVHLAYGVGFWRAVWDAARGKSLARGADSVSSLWGWGQPGTIASWVKGRSSR